jgi:hypothetical protein
MNTSRNLGLLLLLCLPACDDPVAAPPSPSAPAVSGRSAGATRIEPSGGPPPSSSEVSSSELCSPSSRSTTFFWVTPRLGLPFESAACARPQTSSATMT